MTREEQDALIRREWLVGTPLREIGEAIGLSAAGVSFRAKTLDLGPHPKRRTTPERDARFRRMWAAGETHQKIADALGIALGSIKTNANRLGLDARRAYHLEKTVVRAVPVAVAERPRPATAKVRRPDGVRNPKWTAECDALIAATGGRYAEIERLSTLIGRPTSEINARWLRIRGRS
ncbi:hypothetical protein QKW60_05640 [Defluviimonas aestuarii]|uniref:hypothetical protein n=1 Tax=Albidovulum aestuarii TaxID=1130726 RepID=UPI00249AEB84|nr:hypothetical protein [Defluviimonas aestuarii]MDI3335879.1 hypothetical protein [Defluviimonas aestuarii]